MSSSNQQQHHQQHQQQHQAPSKHANNSIVPGLLSTSSSGRGNITGANGYASGNGTNILFVPSKIAMLLRPNAAANSSSNGGVNNGTGMFSGLGQGQYAASAPGLEYNHHHHDRPALAFNTANFAPTNHHTNKEGPTTTTTVAASKPVPSYLSNTLSSQIANTHPPHPTTEVSASTTRKAKAARTTTPSATKRNSLTPGGKRVTPGRPSNTLNNTTPAAAGTTTTTSIKAIKSSPENDSNSTNHHGQKGLVNKVRQLQKIKAIEKIQSVARGYIARSKVVALRRQRLFEQRQKTHHQVDYT